MSLELSTEFALLITPALKQKTSDRMLQYMMVLFARGMVNDTSFPSCKVTSSTNPVDAPEAKSARRRASRGLLSTEKVIPKKYTGLHSHHHAKESSPRSPPKAITRYCHPRTDFSFAYIAGVMHAARYRKRERVAPIRRWVAKLDCVNIVR